MNNNGITELVFILDRSGSMGGLESDTIGGFNSMIKKQREVEGECYVTTVLFNSTVETIHDRVKLSEVSQMTERDYFTRGNTALIDAIGETIVHIGNIHRYIRPEDVPEKTIFVITTDGYENSSHKYRSCQVKDMINTKKALGWEFIFAGANIDAVETASELGINENRSVNYKADKTGTNILFTTVANVVKSARMENKIDDNWSMEIDKDMKSR